MLFWSIQFIFKERIRIGPFLKAGTDIALKSNLTIWKVNEKEKKMLNIVDINRQSRTDEFIGQKTRSQPEEISETKRTDKQKRRCLIYLTTKIGFRIAAQFIGIDAAVAQLRTRDLS